MDGRSGDTPLSGQRRENDSSRAFRVLDNFRPSRQPPALPLPAHSISFHLQAASALWDAARPAARIPAADWSKYEFREPLRSHPPTHIPPFFARHPASALGCPSALQHVFRARVSPIVVLPLRTRSKVFARTRACPVPLPPARLAHAYDPAWRSARLQYLFVSPASRDNPCSVSLSVDAHPSAVAFPRAASSPAPDRNAAAACLLAAVRGRGWQCVRSNSEFRCPAVQNFSPRSPNPHRTTPRCSGSQD